MIISNKWDTIADVSLLTDDQLAELIYRLTPNRPSQIVTSMPMLNQFVETTKLLESQDGYSRALQSLGWIEDSLDVFDFRKKELEDESVMG